MEHKKHLSLSSVVIGFLLALCLMLAVGAASSDGLGRYQCCSAGSSDISVFVIDTQTGRTWRLSRTDTYDLGTPQNRKSDRQSITPIVK
jgi:hypothetical protein